MTSFIRRCLRLAVLGTLPALAPVFVAAQAAAPQNWHHTDPQKDQLNGVATTRAYDELLRGRPEPKPVVVAVIDGGTDVHHEDLKGRIWVNEKEIAGNGKDDDGNGYVDDIYGWNFIGGPDSSHVNQENLEVTRELVRLETKQAAGTALSPDEQQYLARVKAEYDKGYEEALKYRVMYGNIRQAIALGKMLIRTDTLTREKVEAWQPASNQQRELRAGLLQLLAEVTEADVEEGYQDLNNRIEYNYNKNFDARAVVGDDPWDTGNRFYGNNDVVGPRADHGTHVAGIIAAVRDNNLGAVGVATPVRIMAIRSTPDGDERDKDVANAVRYAVDNGARIINMSFGKPFSPQKDYVDAAFRYAQERGVLVVHGSGNESKNLDVESVFPSREDAQQRVLFDNWIEVGANNWKPAPELVSSFSNYGNQSVDIFAPGEAIYSTYPANTYRNQQGTSMAAPVVAGVAAVVWAYYPSLTAQQVKDILLRSATKLPKVKVKQPVEDGEAPTVAFETLSVSDGIVNLYEALRLADQVAKGKAK